jgi:hypothetical protein
MNKPIKPRNNGKTVPHRLICWGSSCFLLVAFLFPISSLPAKAAGASDLNPSGNVAITLDNRVEMLLFSGKVPFAENHRFNVLLSHRNHNFLSVDQEVTTTVSKHIETPLTTGKLLITGGLGKRILTLSAELYDSKTQCWLSSGCSLNTGRRARASAIPFNNKRMLVWVGLIVPF